MKRIILFIKNGQDLMKKEYNETKEMLLKKGHDVLEFSIDQSECIGEFERYKLEGEILEKLKSSYNKETYGCPIDHLSLPPFKHWLNRETGAIESILEQFGSGTAEDYYILY